MTASFARGHATGARSALVALPVLVALLALLGWWLTRPSPAAVAAGGRGHYLVEMDDYDFSPSHMTWRVGEQETLTFVNRSGAHPGKEHEFMMGRGPRQSPGLLGPRQEDGFERDFFTGTQVWFGDADGVEMLMPGEAKVTGKEASKYFMRMPMSSMTGMSSSPARSPMPSASPSMTMPMPSASPSMTMPMPSASPSMTMSMRPSAGMTGEQMVMKGNGLMIVLEPGGRATIRFTVPDRPGTWTYGCFAQSGQHFLNGMRGTVTIVE